MKTSLWSFSKFINGTGVSTLLALLITTSVNAQNAGDLRTNFGSGGRLVLDIGDIDGCDDILFHQDRLYAVGNTTNASALNQGDYLILVLNQSGDLDSNAFLDGVVRGDFPGFPKSRITRITPQYEGLIALGAGSIGSDTQSIVISRFNADASLDTSFGVDGHRQIEILGMRNDPGDIAVLPSGKILVCGTTYDSNYQHKELPFVGRLEPDGSLDTTFSPSGFKVWNPIDGFTDAWNFQLRPGRHSAGGGFYACAVLSEHEYALAGVYNSADYWGFRLLIDMSQGSVFNTHYSLITPALSGYHSDLIFRDGTALAIGTPAGHFGPENFVVQTIGSYGEISNSHEVDFDGNQDQSRAMCLDPSGRILIAGYSKHLTQNDPGFHSNSFAVAAIDHPWVMDFGFGTEGKVQVQFPGIEAAGAHGVCAVNEVIYIGGYVGPEPGADSTNLQDIGLVALENPDRPLNISALNPTESACPSIRHNTGMIEVEAKPTMEWILYDLSGGVVKHSTGLQPIPPNRSSWMLLRPVSDPNCPCIKVPPSHLFETLF